MEPYRRDEDEPRRDPETGQVLDADGAAGDRTVYDQAEHDRDTDRDRNLDEGVAAGDRDDSLLGDRSEHDTNDGPLGGGDTGLTGHHDDTAHTGVTTGSADPVHTTGGFAGHDGGLTGSSDLGEPVASSKDGTAAHGESGDQSDLIVYPEEADYPTRSSEDDSLTAGVPDLEPDPVLVTNDNDHGDDVRRSEAEAATPVGSVTGAGDTGGTGAIDFQQRWREVQAGFVDDPRDAVERADQLVDEAVSAITSRRQGLVDRWKNSDQSDTENLRLALRDYRSLLEDLVGLSYSSAGQGSSPARHEVR